MEVGKGCISGLGRLDFFTRVNWL